jgi:hypothetical protein
MSLPLPPFVLAHETPMKIPGAGLIRYGGPTYSGSEEVYGVYLVGSQVTFGVFQLGVNSYLGEITDINNVATGTTSLAAFISPRNNATGAQELLWISAIGFQTAVGTGPFNLLSVSRDAAVVSGASTRSVPAIACAQSGNNVCAVGWTGINPPPSDLNKWLAGNVNLATNISGSFNKSPALSNGIPYCYADGPPVMTFVGNRLHLGYIDGNNENVMIIWSDDYENFTSASIGIPPPQIALGAMGPALAVVWVDGTGALNLGYWNGDPSGPMTQQGLIGRNTATGGQAVHGTSPTIASYNGGLILSWMDATNGSSTATIGVP